MFRKPKHERQIDSGMPEEFRWSIPAAQAVSMLSNLEFERLDDPELSDLKRLVRDAHREIIDRGLIEAASRFALEDDPKRSKKRDAASWGVRQLICAMMCAADAGIEPFASEPVRFVEDPEPERDWSILPDSLAPLAEFAERFGHLQFEGNIVAFLDHASEQEWDELRRLAAFYSEHHAAVDEFSMREDLEDRPEMHRVFSLPLLLDHAGLTG